jgi:NDP-sugar pyrophosphorylase family protein
MLSALVLAAGLGTRLDPLTRFVAKPAVPLGGYTLIERILSSLRHHGIADVVVNLHHRPASITSVIGDGAALGLHVRYSWEPDVLGSAGGPRRALPLLDVPDFFVVNGDTLADVGLAPILGTHTSSRAAVTLGVVPNHAPDRYGGVVLDEDHGVLGFVPKGQAEGSWHFIGVQIARASTFADLEDGRPAESIAGLYRAMIARTPGSIRAHTTTGAFFDVGTPRDYLASARHIAGVGQERSVVEPGATVDPAAVVRRSAIWPGASVAAGADLDHCVVAGAARVPRGFRARDAVLIPADATRPDDDVEVREGVASFPIDGRPGDRR